jgi:hypothetical protein
VSIPEHQFVEEGSQNATRYGTDLALLAGAEGQLDSSGLWLRVEVRDGRPQLVAIESRESEHPITTSALRFPVDKAVRQLIREYTVRVQHDPETGEPYGLHVTSPTGAGEIRSRAERTQDIDHAAGVRKRGRPRLTDDFLSEVAVKWDNGLKAGGGASYELAREYGVEPSTVRQWMFKARARGLAQRRNDG